jgi:hypothetical protein
VQSLGGVAERSNAAVSKTVSGSWVRRGFKSLPLRFVFLAAVAGTFLIEAPAADAHVRSGLTAVDFRAGVSSSPGVLSVHVYDSDLALALTVAEGNDVVVLGHLGEPAIRIDDDGVAVNEASPTARGMGLVKRSGRSWEHTSNRRSVVWHDSRLRGLPPGVDRGRWQVPLLVNGQRSRLAGEAWRVRAPSAWPWFVLGLPFVGAIALLLVLRRPQLFRSAAVSFGILSAAGAVVGAAGFAFDTYSSEGKWVEAANELIFVLVGVIVVVRGSPVTRALAGGALGLLGLAVGLTKIPVFLHGVVLSALPAGPARVLVALTIWAGAAATAAGLSVFADVLEPAP